MSEPREALNNGLPPLSGNSDPSSPNPFEKLKNQMVEEELPGIIESGDVSVDTSNGKTDGLDKCPTCGSSEIRYNTQSHNLQCMFCRAEWSEANADTTFGFDSDISSLRGRTVASGAQKIEIDDNTITIGCQGCGAEIVINTENALQARCHWCRQTLSVNKQIPNGSVPDAILPFTITRDEAVEQIRKFSKKRQFFAAKKFKKDFEPENVVGIFLPYMIIDGNLSGEISGKGEILTRRYTVTVGTGDNKRTETRYNADVYSLDRSFDFTVDDLPAETSSKKIEGGSAATNNILNSLLPYDTKNSVTYNSNYMKGFTSEKRDLDIDDIDENVVNQFLSIARSKATAAARQYDRGIKWDHEKIDVHGTRWVSVYLPIWLYSYSEESKKQKGFTHYIAVNGRDKRVMGSIPVNHFRLAVVSAIATIGAFAGLAPIFWR
jgi:ribosomal protein S27E